MCVSTEGWKGEERTKGTIGSNESGMAIRSEEMDPKGKGDAQAHLLILQAPQAENCSRVVFG